VPWFSILGLDPNIAEVFSEIRVSRALPQLPPSVRNPGVTVDVHRSLLPEGYSKTRNSWISVSISSGGMPE
jgi:hypothetical protein